MIIQNARHEEHERINKTKLMEWESPKWLDDNGGTIGERRL
ncbi:MULTISPECIES: hypothetical protein [Bacillales]|nr:MULTISPECIES: hypothetical protein [Bacillales]